ncbi:hypothetical protein [Jatrophihabitans sp.]|uniref:hypothetical protein n=1 Tax=Jatrophihabitans sp. TaxID=1932789 RepID=UPI002C7C0AF2|nr:hypothetical protein [Jatrophihabitans sp.]
MESQLQEGASPVPPQNVLPAILPLAAVLHRQPALVVSVTHAEVYPSGCALFVSVRANVVTLDEQRFLGGLLANYAQDVGEFTVAIVRDGLRQVAEFMTIEEGGLFYRITAGGSGQHYRISYWLTPLPVKSCTLLVHSPPLGIDMAELALDPSQLAAAALRAEELWPGLTGEHQIQSPV